MRHSAASTQHRQARVPAAGGSSQSERRASLLLIPWMSGYSNAVVNPYVRSSISRISVLASALIRNVKSGAKFALVSRGRVCGCVGLA